jgi:hypothetical protein
VGSGTAVAATSAVGAGVAGSSSWQASNKAARQHKNKKRGRGDGVENGRFFMGDSRFGIDLRDSNGVWVSVKTAVKSGLRPVIEPLYLNTPNSSNLTLAALFSNCHVFFLAP